MNPIIGFYGIQDRLGHPYPMETHDHSICRIVDRRVVHHVSLERWTRAKHDNRLSEYIDELLEELLEPNDQPVLACADSFVGRGFISRSGGVRVEASPHEPLSEKLIPGRGSIKGKEVETWIVSHELAHIGSSLPFLGRWEDETLLIHYDGAASHSCCSAWLWRNEQLQLLHSGWDTFAAVSQYGTNELAISMLGHGWHNFLSVPGKMMGLAPYAQPSREIRQWLDRHDWFVKLPDGPSSFKRHAEDELNWMGEFSPVDPLVQTIAACFQERFEEAVLAFVARFADAVGAKHLVVAGGGALNLPANQLIADNFRFSSVFIPPCASDDGLGLGAASLVHYFKRGPLDPHSPFLNNHGAPTLSPQSVSVVNAVADCVASGKTVGTCLGAAEVGPRALGHRSLLVRPTQVDAQRLSVQCKQREAWRPVAPLILAEHADEYFEGNPSRSHLARFMLGRHTAKKKAYVEMPGVVHVDGTARLQIVDHQPELYPLRQLLESLYDRHSIAALVNTSFNLRGEPMVQTYEQAIDAARRMHIDRLWHDGGLETLSH